MYTQIKNFFHIRFLMNIYSIRNMITGNGAVWLKLNTPDLENMVEITLSRLSPLLAPFFKLHDVHAETTLLQVVFPFKHLGTKWSKVRSFAVNCLSQY